MKTKQEMRDELVRITDSPYYFKEHPQKTGAMINTGSKKLSPITEEIRKRLHTAVVEMGQYAYRFISGDGAPGSYAAIFDAVSEDLEPLITYEVVPISYGDEIEPETLYAVVGTLHIDTLYDVLYKYSRVGIIDSVLDDLA